MFEIIKQKRKTLSLKVDKDWKIIVKAPKYATQKEIENFIEKHKDWILKEQNKALQNKTIFQIWQKFLFFWELFELKQSEKKKFYFDKDFFYTSLKIEEEIRKEFIKFYKKEAYNYISKRIVEFCLLLNIDFNKLSINSAKTRWWSCNSNKNINFSFRLILAPKNSIDYVIIHELAHLTEMNHSRQFWSIVDNYCRQVWLWDYRQLQKWLKINNLKTNF